MSARNVINDSSERGPLPHEGHALQRLLPETQPRSAFVSLFSARMVGMGVRRHDPPPGYFKREHRIDFECAEASADRKWCFIDFVISYDDGTLVFLEVDEHQHRFGYDGVDGAHLSCDSKRMANVLTSSDRVRLERAIDLLVAIQPERISCRRAYGEGRETRT